MEENSIAKFLRIVGIVESISGVILAIILLGEDGDLFPIAIAIIVVALINGLMFLGFAEIIKLLQKNVDNQDKMMAYLQDKALHENTPPKTVLEDIEANLPQM